MVSHSAILADDIETDNVSRSPLLAELAAERIARERRKEKERADSEALAHEYAQAIAEGRVETMDASGNWVPVPGSDGVVREACYRERYADLVAQGLDKGDAHRGAIARSRAEASLRASGFYDRPRRTASASAMPARPVARNDNHKPTSISATPFVLRDPSTLARRQWLLGRFALRKEISVTVAPGGVGKTALSHCEAIALASGRDFLGFDVPAPLRVWIWNGEEPAEEMERRIGAICLYYGVSADDLGDRLFVDTEDSVKLVLCEQDRNGAKVLWPVINPLVDELKRRKIDFLVIDPFVTTHNCTENDNNAMEKAAAAWKTVAKQANCAVHLVHHTRKANGQVVTSDSSRGGDAVVSKARAVRPLNPLSVKDAKKMGLSRHEGASIFYHDPSGAKVNMVGRGGGCEWFKIVSVALRNETIGDLDVGDEIGVVTRWTPPEMASLSLDDDALAAFKAELACGFHLCSPQAHTNAAWVGHVIARCFELPVDQHDQWKSRAKAIWKQLLDEGEVIEVRERDDRHQEKKIGRPAPTTATSWQPGDEPAES